MDNKKESYLNGSECLKNEVNLELEKLGQDFRLTENDSQYFSALNYLKGLTSKQKNIILQILFERYWDQEYYWLSDEFDINLCGQARQMALDILPISPLSEGVQKFFLERLGEFIERGEKAVAEARKEYAHWVDFPSGDIEFLTYLLPNIDVKKIDIDERKLLIERINKYLERSLPEVISSPLNWLIYQLNGGELITLYFDNWARLANDKYCHLSRSETENLDSLIFKTIKLQSGKKFPDKKWLIASEKIFNDTEIDFYSIFQYLEMLVSMPDKAEWYWNGKTQHFCPSLVVSDKNTKLIQPLIWIFSFCKDTELLTNLLGLVPRLVVKHNVVEADDLCAEGHMYCVSLKLARAIIWAIKNSNLKSREDLLIALRRSTDSTTLKSDISRVIKQVI